MPKGDPAGTARSEFDRAALPHLDSLWAAALHLTGDRDRAGDLVQDTFLRAFRFFHQFEPGTNCRAWLMTILHNAFRNRYRAEQRTRSHLDVDDPQAEAEASLARPAVDDPETLVFSKLLDAEVAGALAALPAEFREAIVLVDLGELSYEEGARALGCPIGTVRSRLARGRRLLETKLLEYARERGYRRG